MYIIHRYENPQQSLDNRFDEHQFSKEFKLLRNAYWLQRLHQESFGKWLLRLGAAHIVTTISEEELTAKSSGYKLHYNEYKVLEIHFKTESDYLVFKLKNL
jgi:hypothetical protein